MSFESLMASVTEEGPDGFEGDYSFRSTRTGNYETYTFMGPGISATKISALKPWATEAKQLLSLLHKAYMCGYGEGIAEAEDAYAAIDG